MCEENNQNPSTPQLTPGDLQLYRVYRLRLFQFLHLFLLYHKMKQDGDVPENAMGHGKSEFASTLQVATLGWLASLVDQNSSALNAFDLWLTLFPARHSEIEAVRAAIQPHLETLKMFRDNVAFHANKSFERQIQKYDLVCSPEVSDATDKFFGLCIKLIREEDSIPALKEEKAKYSNAASG